MLEKKGFFRRVFSFGSEADRQGPGAGAVPETRVDEVLRPDQTAAEPPVAIASHDSDPVPPTDGEAPRAASEMLPGADLAAGAPVAETDTAVEPLLAETDEPVVVRADEPEWLAADAPEPEADFSWLEADVPVDPAEGLETREPAGSTTPKPFTERAQSTERPEPTERAQPDEIAVASTWVAPESVDAAPETASEIIADASPAEDHADPRADDDFSFLEPDAPLPDAEEDADFSWLASDAPLPDAPAEDALPGALARTVPADAGFRLRETAAPAPVVPAVRVPWFEKLREGLARSSSQLSGSITALFTKRRLDEQTLQDFEDVLIQADLGVETALRITDRLSEGRFGKEISGDEVRSILADEVEATLRPVAVPLELDLEKKPHVILVVGVNGTGKTTTIGKLAAKLTRGGLKVTLCAGDTFRAAAVEQLKVWGERTGSTVIAKAIGADAAGLAFEAYDAAVENGSDVLIIDTAGRLQNRTELMAELEKIVRVLQRREPDAPHTVLQTLDATTGQNALNQVEIFRNVAGVNGLVMTKLDGTARGGILVAIAAKFKLPVYFIGVGEGIDDLEPFKARDFALAIAGNTGAAERL